MGAVKRGQTYSVNCVGIICLINKWYHFLCLLFYYHTKFIPHPNITSKISGVLQKSSLGHLLLLLFKSMTTSNYIVNSDEYFGVNTFQTDSDNVVRPPQTNENEGMV